MKKIILNDTYGYEEFITNEEQENLLFWTNSNSHLFQINTTNSHTINATLTLGFQIKNEVKKEKTLF